MMRRARSAPASYSRRQAQGPELVQPSRSSLSIRGTGNERSHASYSSYSEVSIARMVAIVLGRDTTASAPLRQRIVAGLGSNRRHSGYVLPSETTIYWETAEESPLVGRLLAFAMRLERKRAHVLPTISQAGLMAPNLPQRR